MVLVLFTTYAVLFGTNLEVNPLPICSNTRLGTYAPNMVIEKAVKGGTKNNRTALSNRLQKLPLSFTEFALDSVLPPTSHAVLSTAATRHKTATRRLGRSEEVRGSLLQTSDDV